MKDEAVKDALYVKLEDLFDKCPVHYNFTEWRETDRSTGNTIDHFVLDERHISNVNTSAVQIWTWATYLSQPRQNQ